MQLRPAIVFDCDGTLTDSHHVIVAAMLRAFSALNMATPSDLAVRKVIGLSLPVAIAKLALDTGSAQQDALVEAYKDAFVAIRQSGDLKETLYPGVKACLQGLKEAGAVLGIATGKSKRGLDFLIEAHGLRHFFDSFQCADGNLSKPHPQMLEKAIFEMAADPSHTVMVGDSPYDIQMAVAAGVRGIGVSWSDHGPQALVTAGASAMLDSYKDWSVLTNQHALA